MTAEGGRAHSFGRMRIPQVPHQDDGAGVVGDGGDELCLLVGVPRHGAHGFPVEVVEGEGLLLGFHVPDGEEPAAAAGDQDVGDLLVPVQAIKVIRSRHLVAQHEGAVGVVEIPYVELD